MGLFWELQESKIEDQEKKSENLEERLELLEKELKLTKEIFTKNLKRIGNPFE